jgi:peptidoglycan/LPS O-acetylase OafA/YrhL
MSYIVQQPEVSSVAELAGSRPEQPDAPTSWDPVPPARIFCLDNLRVLLTSLVVLHHAAVTYGNIPIWYYTEPAKDSSGTVLDLFVVFNQMFFMGFFFLIAGYFVPGSYDRKGHRVFWKDRLVRLGIPVLVFAILLRPILMAGLYPTLRAQISAQGTDLPYWLLYLVTWDPGPLWFAEVLLAFSGLYVLYRKRRGKEPGSGDLPTSGGESASPRKVHFAIFALALAAATYVWRLIVPLGQYWPIVGLPTPAYLPQYASLFVVGILAYRRGWLQALSASDGWFGLAMAILGTAVLMPIAAQADLKMSVGHGTWQSFVQSLWESLFAVGIITALIVLFRQRWNSQGRRGEFLVRQAYAVYMLHPLVLVGLGYAFAWLSAPAIVKFAIMAALALPLCWAVAAAVRSVPSVRRVL